MRKLGTLVLLFAVIVCSAHSQLKSFIKDYSFEAGEADSKLTARAYALEQVKRVLLEEVGVYLHSTFENTDVEKQLGGKSDFESLTKQQTTAITAGIVETKILDEKWDGTHYYVKAEVTLDPRDVSKKVRAIMNREDNLAAMAESRQKADAALAEATRLREELRKTKSEVDRLRLGKSLEKESSVLRTSDWFEGAHSVQADGHLEEAVIMYNKVIGLDSSHGEAYNNRGAAKFELKDYAGAIADYDHALNVKPGYAEVYYNRGLAKSELHEYAEAVFDFDRAIKLKADYLLAYYYRGLAKSNNHDYRSAIADQSKVIALRRDFVPAYHHRGTARYELSDYKGAIDDFNKAIELKPDDSSLYLARGIALRAVGDVQNATADFRKAKASGGNVPAEWLETKK
jgi:tetratricopeptide (TPR) repeat protein